MRTSAGNATGDRRRGQHKSKGSVSSTGLEVLQLQGVTSIVLGGIAASVVCCAKGTCLDRHPASTVKTTQPQIIIRSYLPANELRVARDVLDETHLIRARSEPNRI